MNREYFNLARAIAAEDSPCMPCVNWSRCAKKEMACEAYKNYYETGDIMGNKEPTTIIYKGIFDVGFGSA
jgi:hypothetical protein